MELKKNVLLNDLSLLRDALMAKVCSSLCGLAVFLFSQSASMIVPESCLSLGKKETRKTRNSKVDKENSDNLMCTRM